VPEVVDVIGWCGSKPVAHGADLTWGPCLRRPLSEEVGNDGVYQGVMVRCLDWDGCDQVPYSPLAYWIVEVVDVPKDGVKDGIDRNR